MKTEGRNAVSEIIKSVATVDKVMVENGMRDEASKKLLADIRARRIKVQFADKSVLDKESGRGRHQGFIAFTSDYSYAELGDVLAQIEKRGKDGFIVALDGVEDPHNLGSIIRTCECAGADALIIQKHRSAAVTDTVMRISEGAASHLNVCRVTNLNSALEELKAEGYWIFGAEASGDNIYDTDLRGKTVLVVGGEDSGIKPLTKKNCDRIVSLPLYGKINSLNASVACAAAVYEAVRQRNFGR